ncbi:class I SAM-dependent methyltransferase [Kribbella sindirgiensis]|uniref:Class I SAM-dependent methyltransferase n=1 Tax=Kribbella sindirgiensis TaxID=1124744 RepID=A0A4R0HU59_9ACTN|nr:class I SAM-dependent methyltransferase [Kribbella sindirgiensis]TCC15305.1 class I SAM-dependent methyltransferase [Kribbella sindirgiensis]
MTALGFGGEVAELYQRYRRGYPDETIDALTQAFRLGADDVVLDVGCGTGQLTLPLARSLRAVIGLDPEADMLVQARAVVGDQRNVMWALGSDRDVPAIAQLVGPLAAVTVAQALHWMDHDDLFRTVRPLLRAGGGIAVVTNGVPLWLQDTTWSSALREFLQQWLGTSLAAACGTDERSQEVYRLSLAAAGYVVGDTRVRYSAPLTFVELLGGVLSAMPVEQLPIGRAREEFAARLRDAVGPGPFTEDVDVRLLIGLRD